MSKVDILKEKGYRVTKSRLELLELFEENPNKHFTLDDIVQEFNENINISTLYNNIATFVEENIISEIYVKDKKYFEYNHKIHAHFKCLNCENFFNINIHDIDDLEYQISHEYNVDIDKVDISFSGVCHDCNGKEAPKDYDNKSDIKEYNIVNEYKYDIDLDKITGYLNFLQDQTKSNNKEFSLVFVDNETIKQMNNEYRQKDYVTDVLTFCENEDEYLGDVIVCYPKMLEQAKEYNHSIQRELFFLITHGYLHLLGYDHIIPKDEIEMFDYQNKLLGKYGVKR